MHIAHFPKHPAVDLTLLERLLEKLKLKLYLNETFISGGFVQRCIHNEDPYHGGDIDIYFLDDVYYAECIHSSIVVGVQDAVATELTWSFTFCNVKFQYIKLPPDSKGNRPDCVREVLDGFDLTCVQVATDLRRIWYASDAAKIHLHEKILCVHKVTRPAAALKRLVKYANMGYKFDSDHDVTEAMRLLAETYNELNDTDRKNTDGSRGHVVRDEHIDNRIRDVEHDEGAF